MHAGHIVIVSRTPLTLNSLNITFLMSSISDCVQLILSLRAPHAVKDLPIFLLVCK